MCKFCDGGCACHVSPPCSFCVAHIECEICGQQVCEDMTEEIADSLDGTTFKVCPDCYNKEVI